MEIQTWGPPSRDRVARHRGRTVPGRADGSPRSRRPPVGRARGGCGLLAASAGRARPIACDPFKRSKKARAPRRAPSGRCVDSTLMTVAPDRARRSPHRGPAHRADRSMTTSAGEVGSRRRLSEPSRDHGGTCGRGDGWGRLPDTSATGSPSSWARSRQDAGVALAEPRRHGRPRGGRGGGCGVELEPGRDHLHVLVAGERHGQEPVGAGQQAAAPSAAGRPPSPQPHRARRARPAVRVRPAPGTTGPSGRPPSTRPCGGPSGSSGQPVSAIAPLLAQRCTGGSSTSAG